MLFTLIVSTLSCGLVFGADSPAPADPTLCGLPAIQDINLLPNHHGDKQLKYVIRRTSDVKIQDVNWRIIFKSKNGDHAAHSTNIITNGSEYFSVNTTNEDWVASVSIKPYFGDMEFVLSAFLGDAQDMKHSQSVTIKNGAVHKPGNNLGRIVMHLIIIVFISVFISVYCGAYYWTKKNKQAQVVNENSTSNV
eukprot:419096_1